MGLNIKGRRFIELLRSCSQALFPGPTAGEALAPTGAERLGSCEPRIVWKN